MGEVAIPDGALWGASTQRAVLNFPISGLMLPPAFVRSLAWVKAAAAQANADLGKLPLRKSALIQAVAAEIAAGSHASQFPVDIFQSGSGTSTNTNINEVIALRSLQLPGVNEGDRLHPNDDVNLGQSSNDVIPTALHVSVSVALQTVLLPSLECLAGELEAKSKAFSNVVKIGRTHLMDATPRRLPWARSSQDMRRR